MSRRREMGIKRLIDQLPGGGLLLQSGGGIHEVDLLRGAKFLQTRAQRGLLRHAGKLGARRRNLRRKAGARAQHAKFVGDMNHQQLNAIGAAEQRGFGQRTGEAFPRRMPARRGD